MPPKIEMPMNTANQHAASAEEYAARGLIVLAAEEHDKASEALLAAIDRSHDESAKRTLRLLYNKHCKERDDLHKRIEKLKSEGKDPNLPQIPDHPAATQSRQNPHAPPSNLQSSANTPHSMQQYPRPMTDSQNTVDESFMVLGGQRSDPGDAFNQFWNAMQGMLDNLSQPVAFATAPLGNEAIASDDPSTSQTYPPSTPLRRDSSLSSDTDNDEHMLSKWTRKMGINRERTKSKSSSSGRQKAGTGPSRKESTSSSFQDDDFEDDDDFLEAGTLIYFIIESDETQRKLKGNGLGSDLSGSFCLIPSGSDASPAALRKENIQLKAEMTAVNEKLAATEQVLRLRKDQDMQLRNSIFEKLMITKFRERWEKLKESAKRKKEAKAAAESHTSGVRDRIVEEPEAEEELDGTGG
ncbi:hypothetical protein EST38_g9988 [Candolleomyces aberdarensis]|uniref:MIT domain-containing protein n=1 Tax=Candolleomyces aberdarensis TaxID=2316362 RepID=A0A4Q2DBU3_9AGAR|nr:hypothetical protein EST38_g9988 [Candolleomyces aberdarensis]